MSTKYITQVDGHTFKRATANRTYTHMVIVEWDVATERAAHIKQAAKDWDTNLAYYTQMATQGFWFYDGNKTQAPEKVAYSPEEIARAKAYLADGKDACIARAAVRFDDSMTSRWMSSSGKTYYTDAGWCGRLDLAQKLAAKYVSHRAVQSVIIRETTEVTGTVKAKVAPKAHHRSV